MPQTYLTPHRRVSSCSEDEAKLTIHTQLLSSIDGWTYLYFPCSWFVEKIHCKFTESTVISSFHTKMEVVGITLDSNGTMQFHHILCGAEWPLTSPGLPWCAHWKMFDLNRPSMTSALFSPLHHQLDLLSIVISLHFNTTNQTTNIVTTKVVEMIVVKRYEFQNVRELCDRIYKLYCLLSLEGSWVLMLLIFVHQTATT